MLGPYLEHILITFVGGSLGLVVGGVAGYALASLLIRSYSASERSMRIGIFVPWRTLVAVLLIPFVISYAILVRFGIGNMTATMTLGIALAGLALASTCGIIVRREFPRSTRVELIAAGRSLFAFGAALLAAVGPNGAWGLGAFMLGRLRLLENDEAFRIFLLIAAAILVFDLGIGVVQYIYMFRRSEAH